MTLLSSALEGARREVLNIWTHSWDKIATQKTSYGLDSKFGLPMLVIVDRIQVKSKWLSEINMKNYVSFKFIDICVIFKKPGLYLSA